MPNVELYPDKAIKDSQSWFDLYLEEVGKTGRTSPQFAADLLKEAYEKLDRSIHTYGYEDRGNIMRCTCEIREWSGNGR